MATVFNIQHFSVGDGDGIRTTVFFHGCNLHCPWCHNPESFTPTAVPDLRCKQRSIESILAEILEDRDYYGNDGGVTFSGGEVLLQAETAAKLARLVKEAELSLFVDTAGLAQDITNCMFEMLNPFTDVYLFDYKTASADQYASAIGGDLALIRENIRRLLADGKEVRIRIPLIPGFNTDAASVDAICEELSALGIRRVELLPFHRLGSGKYETLGLDYAYRHTSPLTKETLTAITDRFAADFAVSVE